MCAVLQYAESDSGRGGFRVRRDVCSVVAHWIASIWVLADATSNDILNSLGDERGHLGDVCYDRLTCVL